ncbi:S-layer homology domain-containing protein [Deinococcus peraridilitoris]|uniref:Membrane-bound metallopeptidase n=1 Tax=Deinococcus peraridilitoris (strain DSM 19664 / LMG 22246 / CIP 109416 / KR-200) TaxID=937777 RepID=L0A6K0_DEIPD|nr:S-layer homology domain-containing protein [Deinococcus peraridilitoris]AFZ68812.1 membrane-bound metallopeptidase [Deinococcus peraridilitoris DSM 19664]
MRKPVLLVSALTVALGLGAAAAQTNTTQTTTQAPASFSDVPAGHWAREAVELITQRGLIQGFPDGTFRGNENLTRYQAALIFFRLLQSGQLSSMTPQDQGTVAQGMAEVAAELASVTARLNDLEAANAQQQARLQALEQQVQRAGSAATTGNTAALEQRIAALEQAIQTLQRQAATPAPAPAPAGNTTALEQRIAALEQRAAQPAPAPSTPPASNTGVAVVPGQGTTVVVGSGAAPIITSPNTFVGISGNYAFGSPFSFSTLGYNVTLGTSNLFGRFGGRLDVGFAPGTGAIDGAASLKLDLASGTLEPYVGLGAGATYSAATDGSGASVLDYYANSFFGADFRFTDTLAVFAEVNPRYYFSNMGSASMPGFGIGAKAGLKFFF